MSKETLKGRLAFLEGFVGGVSSRIEALENKVAELSTSNQHIKYEKDCSTCKYTLDEFAACIGCLNGGVYVNWEQSSSHVD